MKIYTKTGDKGTTSLVGGVRVAKNHCRVNAYGDVDELISNLGLLRAMLIQLSPSYQTFIAYADQLLEIEKTLMIGAACLASNSNTSTNTQFDLSKTAELEQIIDTLTLSLPPQKYFILPSSPVVAAQCHIARTVCRRAERSGYDIEDLTQRDNVVLQYLNRLSDYLFTLARKLCIDCSIKEEFWIP